MAVFMFKLVTGDDVLGQGEKNKGYWKISKAVKIGYTPQGIMMLPYNSFFKEDEITVREEHVVLCGEVSTEIFNAYNAKYGSGIELATSNTNIKLVGD